MLFLLWLTSLFVASLFFLGFRFPLTRCMRVCRFSVIQEPFHKKILSALSSPLPSRLRLFLFVSRLPLQCSLWSLTRGTTYHTQAHTYIHTEISKRNSRASHTQNTEKRLHRFTSPSFLSIFVFLPPFPSFFSILLFLFSLLVGSSFYGLPTAAHLVHAPPSCILPSSLPQLRLCSLLACVGECECDCLFAPFSLLLLLLVRLRAIERDSSVVCGRGGNRRFPRLVHSLSSSPPLRLASSVSQPLSARACVPSFSHQLTRIIPPHPHQVQRHFSLRVLLLFLIATGAPFLFFSPFHFRSFPPLALVFCVKSISCAPSSPSPFLLLFFFSAAVLVRSI